MKPPEAKPGYTRKIRPDSAAVNFRGGILPAETLRALAAEIRRAGVRFMYPGNRQNLYFRIGRTADPGDVRRSLERIGIPMETSAAGRPNIVSSYPALELFAPPSWLNEGIIRDVLDAFDFQPSLRINVVDMHEGLTIPFDADVVFAASPHQNFWYVFIRDPDEPEFHCWHDLVYNTDVAAVARRLDAHLTGKVRPDYHDLYRRVRDETGYIAHERDVQPALPRYTLPEYEGVRINGDRSWIGVTSREDRYATDFLEALAALCIGTGTVFLTPWKSLLVRNIKERDIGSFQSLLGRFGINTRHSAIELNWRLPDLDAKAAKLKRKIIRGLDRRGVWTGGLVFGIASGGDDDPQASVIVRRHHTALNPFPYYDVYRSKDFNPNTRRMMLVDRVGRMTDLVTTLHSISRQYLSLQVDIDRNKDAPETGSRKLKRYWSPETVHQCRDCRTVYDPEFGDDLNGIPAGIPFSDLGADYACPACGAPKTEFIPIGKTIRKEAEL
jgi:rubredoxin